MTATRNDKKQGFSLYRAIFGYTEAEKQEQHRQEFLESLQKNRENRHHLMSKYNEGLLKVTKDPARKAELQEIKKEKEAEAAAKTCGKSR